MNQIEKTVEEQSYDYVKIVTEKISADQLLFMIKANGTDGLAGIISGSFKDGFIAGATQSQPKWISVKDRYPKDYERVLLWDNRDKYPLSVSVGYLVASQTRPDYITHWKPLPESI